MRSLSLVFLLGAATPEWVERSNENAKILLETMAKTSPESAARQGIESVDREILDLKPGYVERNRKLLEDAGAKLRERLAAERDARVREDLEILVRAADLDGVLFYCYGLAAGRHFEWLRDSLREDLP